MPAPFDHDTCLLDDSVVGLPSTSMAAEPELDPPAPPPEEEARYVPVDPATGREAPSWVAIGKGGLGEVLAALDKKLGRTVALKRLRPRTGSTATARFLREAQVAARLEHPAIVPVHDAGRSADGVCFYTMRHVRGRTLSAALQAANGLQERLALLGHFADLCQAIAFAHSQGVLHRDIKPDNVMVGAFGETVVLDWGLAGLHGHIDSEEPGASGDFTDLDTGATRQGAVLGTPAYMSPEQAAGRSDEVDERSDTWSLGVVLFELLTGKRPFQGATVREVLDQVKEAPIPRVADLAPEVPADLAAIAERALSRPRDRRYPDAGALARDVEAFRAGALVGAHHYTPAEHLRRFVARNRGAVGVASLAGVLLVGLGGASWQRVLGERDRAVTAEHEANAGRQEALANLAEALEQRAEAAWLAGEIPEAWLYAAKVLTLAEKPDARGIVLGAATTPTPVVLGAVEVPEDCRAWRRDPTGHVLACHTDGEVILWRGRGDPERLRPTDAAAKLTAFALGPGAQVAAIVDRDSATWLLDGSGKETPLPTHTRTGASELAFSPDGRRLYGSTGTWSQPDTLLAWDVATGEELARREDMPGRGVDVSPDGRLVAALDPKGLVLLDPEDLKTLARRSASGWRPRFSSNGRYIALDSSSGAVILADTRDGQEAVELMHAGGMGDLEWSSRGELLASVKENGEGWLLSTDTTRPPFRFPGPSGRTRPAFLPGKDVVLVRAEGGQLRAWDVGPIHSGASMLGRPRVAYGFSLSPQGMVATTWSSDGGQVRVWDADGAPLATLGDEVHSASFSPDGSQLLCLEVDHASVVDLSTWETMRTLPVKDLVATTWTHGGALIATAVRPNNQVHLWDAATGVELARLEISGGSFPQLVATADGAMVGLDPDYASLLRIDPATLQRSTLAVLPSQAQFLQASANGRWLVVGFSNGELAIYDGLTGVERTRWTAHVGPTRRVAVSNSGDLVASAGPDHVVVVWRSSEHRVLARLTGQEARTQWIRFSADEERLYTTDSGGHLRLWDLRLLDAPPEALLARVRQRFGIALDGVEVVATPLETIPLSF